MKAVVPNRRLERSLWQRGHNLVGGIDEVGRGPMAGPVTVAVVVLPERCRLKGVSDSKLLSAKKRQEMLLRIQDQAIGIGLGWAAAAEIDSDGLTGALRKAGLRALAQLPAKPDVLILDGKHNYLGSECLVETCVKADQSSLAVAAASIVAKVARDRYMELVDRSCPGYGFLSHKGYATRSHRLALESLGLSPHHRRRWSPVQLVTVVD